ncbi:MAG: DUF2490 domain-containing protein [Pedobacter sp.]|nr:MAG: DUF2490 domain-containing protein [Pedobacter sp.]
MLKYILTLMAILSMNFSAEAQTIHQNSGWLFLMNITKFNDKWGMHFDLQIRTQNEWEGVRNLLVRPGITYYINKNSDVTLGYLLTPTFINAEGVLKNTLTEHRIWEQYIYKHKINAVNVSHRFRLEQRFIERNAPEDLFSQRLRYFVRFIIPIKSGKESFEKGFFAALQNEVFLNVQHKNELNGSIFDQNRAYGATGYRFNKKIDLEAGYMNQSVKGLGQNTSNHIIQLAFYTRF